MPYPSKISVEQVAEAAAALAREGGLSAVGVRSVAKRLNVRPTALYRYCTDGEGLVALVAEHAASQLAGQAKAAVAVAEHRALGADGAFKALATAYAEFATAEPGLYAALTTDTSGSTWSAQPGVERKALWHLVLQVVGRLTNNPDDTGAAVAAWSFLHGFASLRAAGMFGSSGPRDGFERGLAALIAGLKPAVAP
jgi:AcrR family transcriptional regulator